MHNFSARGRSVALGGGGCPYISSSSATSHDILVQHTASSDNHVLLAAFGVQLVMKKLPAFGHKFHCCKFSNKRERVDKLCIAYTGRCLHMVGSMVGRQGSSHTLF